MSIKSILVYSTLLVLDLSIEYLLLVAHCLNFILHYLNDDPPVNHPSIASTVEETPGGKDDTNYENGANAVGIAPITTGDSPFDAFSQSEVQTHSPSPSATSRSMPTSQNRMATTPLNHQRVDSDVRTPLGPSTRKEPATDSLRSVTSTKVSWNASGSVYRDNDELRLIVPCWDREDEIGEGSTCPVTINLSLTASLDVMMEVTSRTQELFHQSTSYKDPSRLQRASHIHDHLMATSRPSDEYFGRLLLLQALTWSQLLEQTGDVSLLDKSINGLQAGLSLLPHDASHRLPLTVMGELLEHRHRKKGIPEDLDHAIAAYEEVSELCLEDESPPLDLVHHLGVVLRERFEEEGNLSDADRAVYHLNKLLSVIEGDHPLRPRVLRDLGTAYSVRCERTGSMADVGLAIRLLEEALSLQTDDSGDRPHILHNLAIAFRVRHKRSGRVSDLNDAIRLYQKALSLRKDAPGYLNSLAEALWSRYKDTGDATDLEAATCHVEQAIRLIKHDNPRRSSFLGNLANIMLDRYYASKDIADLNKTIDLYEQLLSVQSGNLSDRPGALANLCTALQARYYALSEESDKKRGLDCLTESLSLIPPGHPQRQAILHNFVYFRSTLTPWYTLSTDDLTIILDRCTELANLTPQQHPGYSKMTKLIPGILVVCLLREIDVCQLLLALGFNPESSGEDAALALVERGAKASASPAIDQLAATCDWIQLHRMLNRPCTLEMFVRMFDVLDVSIARSCSLQTRHVQLSKDINILAGKELVSEAIAFAIEEGTIETAVEFLERGQSILLSQLSRYRSSSLLEALHSIRPDLATRFRDVSRQVEHATFTEGKDLLGIGPEHPLEDPISRSNRLRSDWEDVVQEIRALDGFRHFLRPMPFSILQKAAAEGPVILINISESRSDAIIITSDQPPIAVSLPFATPDQVDRLVSTFKASPQSMSDRKALNGLQTMWDTIVEPVVTELRDTLKLPKNSRIWWCPTNSAVSLPFHAAGLYHMKDDRCLLTRDCLPSLYISSYTPTLGTLIRARQDKHHSSGLPSVLLVGQPNTPYQPEIPEVREEIRVIKKRIPHSVVLMDDCGTHNAVLSEVAQHQWVHLACHGHVQRENPFQSHFSLHDGPLPLLEMMQQQLPTAEFAFLSACHSASGDSSTPDEFLHLAAGMQFAGFRSVVGTMWAMADYAGPPLADEFYRKMFPKKGKVDHTLAAQALHGATKKLWKDGFPLAVWINFVHWGA